MFDSILNLDPTYAAAMMAGGIALLLMVLCVFLAIRLLALRKRLNNTSETSQTISMEDGKDSTVAALQQKLSEREAQLSFQHRSMTALLAISDASEEPLTLEAVFDRALHTVQSVTGFSTVVVRLYDSRRGCFEVMAQHGMSQEMLESMKCAPLDSLNGEAARRRWPMWVPDLSNNYNTWEGLIPAKAGYRTVVSIPLLTENQVVGTMELASTTLCSWSESELAWLALVGRTIGSIIHQVRLTEQMRDFAALEERYRLSQEIHDGLVQVIGSIRLWADDGLQSLDTQDYASVHTDVSKIEAYAREAYANLREEMLGLRDTILPGQDIVPVLREYLSRFQRQWGIEVQLTQNETGIPGGDTPISPKAEIQLLRIIQEALTNVRKHAQATQVKLVLHKDAAGIKVTIQDNGKGFSPELVRGDHLGLHIMKERAASMGGKLEIRAAAGCGTAIIVEAPARTQSAV